MTDTSQSPRALFTVPELGSVKWTDGFWGRKTELCATRIIPNMRALLEDPTVSHCWTNFRVAAGLEEGVHAGPSFHDGDFYKWLEAACFSLALHPDAELKRFVDEAVSVIARVQEPSGYIFTKRAIERRSDPSAAAPLANELNFEVYNLGHLMTAGCVHYRAFGCRELLDVAEKAAAYLDGAFAAVSPENAKTAICPSHYMGLTELYRTTGNRRWLELCRRLMALRDKVKNGTDDNQDRTPLATHREALGHAVRANYLYAGVADLYAESSDDSGPEAAYPEVLESVWKDVVYRKMYITGSCGALYDGVSPYGSEDYFAIQRTHQSYGRPYELPNVTAYNETCAAIGNYLWNWRMFLISGEARFLDVMELVLYNGALAGISLDGMKFFYANALRRAKSLPFSLKWSRRREPYISSFCCPPNLARTIAETPAYAYAASKDPVHPELRVLFYGANTARVALPGGREVRVVQETDYPWKGTVRIAMAAVSGGALFSVAFRIPVWARDAASGGGPSLRINGTSVPAVSDADGFIRVTRAWKAGDELELELPLEPRLMEAHPLLEEARNHVALMRGPLVYCLEEADLPEDRSVFEAHLVRNASFREEPMAVAGELVVALRGSGVLRSASGGTDSGPLYRPFVSATPEPAELTFIPYYAWDNRGFGEMSVWVPLV